MFNSVNFLKLCTFWDTNATIDIAVFEENLSENTERRYKRTPSSILLAWTSNRTTEITVSKRRASPFFFLLDAIRFILCRISSLKCEMYYQVTLSIQGFQNTTEVYPENLKFHILQDHPHWHNYAKHPEQIMLNTLLVSFCFCDPISSTIWPIAACFTINL